MLQRMLWQITPGGLLSIAVILMLVGCAPAPLRGDVDANCVLGVAHAEHVMNRQVFRDPVDALITAAIDSPQGNWQCPAQS